MNITIKKPLTALGYGFVPHGGDASQSPIYKDEYYYRKSVNKVSYRSLTEDEISSLISCGNTAGNWADVMVSKEFSPHLIQDCHFYGLVRIGNLAPMALSHKDLELPVGLYNSTIVSCDFGDHVSITNVHYISHYIVDSEVILFNIDEMVTTSNAKFGNGMVKKGEDSKHRIVLELCNEKAGRSVIPFASMLPGDAYLWTRYRDDGIFQQALLRMTDKTFDIYPGHYGRVGSGTVIKNCKMIKDAKIMSYVYIKGVNKLKNVTVKSSQQAPTQIGEGCELVNGIIGYGCKIFYGVKAVRFILSSHSQLKYGARLINSYLGNNSTVSCCEVLNSLIFPGHEQHHNNSFLCAALVMGQSNMAAGATIGSNHNSRGADGELIAGRGFWPGLCVSLKHNSCIASFVLLTKGNYPHELNIKLPFTLVANDESKNRLILMPAYWFMHNFYALARNCYKAYGRDERLIKKQSLNFDFLAPDTVYEIVNGIELLEKCVGSIFCDQSASNQDQQKEGRRILNHFPELTKEIEVFNSKFENGKRPVILRKVGKAYGIYLKLLRWNLAQSILEKDRNTWEYEWNRCKELSKEELVLPKWMNVGGQLIPEDSVFRLKEKIKTGLIEEWTEVHDFYLNESKFYNKNRLIQAIVAYMITHDEGSSPQVLTKILEESKDIHRWMMEGIKESRQKDYDNPFKRMVYESMSEMETVIGALDQDGFIQQSRVDYELYCNKVDEYLNS
ncbi:DUF4954 family protein [Membranihabitans marinus]|uniref:DUF4954 family protein n=1 Tax=Membranihabitans marinus TaxID=1227546 RepID=UPI001F26EAD4|nr:DUF4954 family protein [Membranihabitans marinus]